VGIAGALLRAQRPDALQTAMPAYARREWAGVAGDNLLISLLQATRAPLIVVIMAPQVGPQHLAYYVAAARLANVMLLGLTGISGMATPQIARHFALSDHAALQRLAHWAARGALVSAAVVAAVLVVLGTTAARPLRTRLRIRVHAAAGPDDGRAGRGGGGPGGLFPHDDRAPADRHGDRGPSAVCWRSAWRSC
jgi:hypothetical protein